MTLKKIIDRIKFTHILPSEKSVELPPLKAGIFIGWFKSSLAAFPPITNPAKPNPLDKVNTIETPFKNAKHFPGRFNYPAPIYMNGGWLVPDWITDKLKKLEDPGNN